LRALLTAQIHSAGHLLDVCMSRCGYPASVLAPTKGSHTPSDAYVEYSGKVPPDDVAPLQARLNASLADAVAAGGAVAAAVQPYAAAAAACGGALPPYIPSDATPRVVVMLPGEPGCPCGGTHVGDVASVGRVVVSGVRVKKGVTRISYVVEGMDVPMP
jgi:Ser-tRNA(Ala) deacylase AlaX